MLNETREGYCFAAIVCRSMWGLLDWMGQSARCLPEGGEEAEYELWEAELTLPHVEKRPQVTKINDWIAVDNCRDRFSSTLRHDFPTDKSMRIRNISLSFFLHLLCPPLFDTFTRSSRQPVQRKHLGLSLSLSLSLCVCVCVCVRLSFDTFTSKGRSSKAQRWWRSYSRSSSLSTAMDCIVESNLEFSWAVTPKMQMKFTPQRISSTSDQADQQNAELLTRKEKERVGVVSNIEWSKCGWKLQFLCCSYSKQPPPKRRSRDLR